MSFSFIKSTGCGNDFILIDHRSPFMPEDPSLWIRSLCDRHFGVGGDGVILWEKSLSADAKMRIFNADGQEAALCGNGLRCLFTLLEQSLPDRLFYTIETLSGLQKVWRHPTKPTLIGQTLPYPRLLPCLIPLPQHLSCSSLFLFDVGVPHLVLFLPSIDTLDLSFLAPALRHHSSLGPAGANINFVTQKNKEWHYRTYERGVEGETLACGTGAVAIAAAICASIHKPSYTCTLHTRSQAILEATLHPQTQKAELYGPAHILFTGTLDTKSPAIFHSFTMEAPSL